MNSSRLIKMIKSQCRLVLSILRDYFIPGNVLVWGMLVLCLSTALASILASGPSIQLYAFALLNGHESSIYGTAYNDTLIKFPSLEKWFIQGIYFPFPSLVAFIASVFALRGKNAAETCIQVSLSSFVALMAIDVWIVFGTQQLTASYLFQNFVANLIGGFLISFLVIALLAGVDSFCEHLPDNRVLRISVACVLIVSLGLLASTGIFYTTKLFYEPAQAKFDVLLEQPLSGYYSTESQAKKEPALNEKKENELPPFALIQRKITAEKLLWRGADGILVAEWSKPKSPEIFDVTIEAFRGCGSNLSAAKVSSKSHEISLRDVKKFRLAFDNGPSDFMAGGEGKDAGNLSLENKQTAMYWLANDSDSESLNLTQFVTKEAKLTQGKDIWGLEFYFVAPLFHLKSDNVLEMGKRKISISSDTQVYEVDLLSKSLSKDIEKVECQSLDFNNALQEGRLDLPPATYVGFRVSINNRESGAEIYKKDDNQVVVTGSGGWVYATYKNDSLSNAKKGRLSVVSFKGNINSLQIDGVQIATRPIEKYDILGEFYGNFENNGRLRFFGTAEAIFKDGARLSPTRWERFEASARGALLSTAGALLLLFFRYVIGRFRSGYTFQLSRARAKRMP